jgi:hypothetical protein
MRNLSASKWKAGRIAAAVLFFGGAFWTWYLFPSSSGEWTLFAAGLLIWALWGMRALNLGPPAIHRAVWILSLLLHLGWLWLAAAATALSGWFALIAVPIQIIWCLIAAIVSSTFILRGSDS